MKSILFLTTILLIITSFMSCDYSKKTDREPTEFIYIGEETDSNTTYDFRNYIYNDLTAPSAAQENGILENETIAVEVAKVIVAHYYGEKRLANEKPYRVALINNKEWFITGSLPKGTEGGVFIISLDKKTGGVISLRHEK